MGYLYTAFVIGISVMLKNILESRWARFKEREALKPQPMVLRKGVYVPWGRVQKIERAGYVALAVWAVYMVALIGIVVYVKFVLGKSQI